MAKADRAGAFKRLPIARADEMSAVASLRNPMGKFTDGFAPGTQMCGSATAVLHYKCFIRVVAPLTCGYLKIPGIGHYDDFGIVAL